MSLDVVICFLVHFCVFANDDVVHHDRYSCLKPIFFKQPMFKQIDRHQKKDFDVE